jgi:hypothetical protein
MTGANPTILSYNDSAVKTHDTFTSGANRSQVIKKKALRG